MGNKIKKRILNGLFGFTIILSLTVVCKTEANAGVSGKGTFDNPYIVDDYKGLNHVLTGENKDKIYIGINGQIEITKNINVSVGEYVIFAYSEDAQIYKSHKVKAEINNPEDPTYCMHVGRYGDTRIEFGTEGNYELILSGKKSKFKEKGIVSSGWMYIYEEGSVVIGEKTKVENMMNNDVDSNLSNITVFGCLDVYGKITKCEGENGGAICGKGAGIVNIHSPSIITNCSSKTEGGAIWIKESSTLTMKGGTITSCAASEEGGAIFISGNSSKGEFEHGVISNNVSGHSGGGIFAGYGAKLMIDSPEGNLYVTGNTSGGSGGGIRANGGVGDNAGGYFYLNGAIVLDNISGKYGGGISVGAPGINNTGKVMITKGKINNNSADNDGGGLCISKNNFGVNSEIRISDCIISNNTTLTDGGGMCLKSDVILTNCHIEKNEAYNHGGGIRILDDVNVVMYSGDVNSNEAVNKGKGIYLQGSFVTGDKAFVASDNEIYICKDKYVEIGKAFTTGYHIALDSKERALGTKLIKVSYIDGTGERVLYGNDRGEEDEYTMDISKRMHHININGKKILRSTGYVNGMDNNWIIISRTYQINYSSSEEGVIYNPKSQTKFYQEDTVISKHFPVHQELILEEDILWNTRIDGTGKIYTPGSTYSIDDNITLYCLWKESMKLFFELKDRYYMVGQPIEINIDEVLRKVRVYDNDDLTDEKQEKERYSIKITSIYDSKNGTYLSENSLGIIETIIPGILTTKKKGEYLLSLKTEYNGVVAYAKMKVFVLEGKYEGEGVRFVSEEYLYTISPNSKWYITKNMNILKGSLWGEAKYVYSFNNNDVEKAKEYVRNNVSNNQMEFFLKR